MKFNVSHGLTALAFAVMATSANAAILPTGPSCTVSGASDPTIGGVQATDCVGYFTGNLLATSNAQTVANLALMPWTVDGSAMAAGEKFSPLNGVATQTFTTALTGDVVLGIHWGGGQGGGQTTFYFWDDLAATSYVVNFLASNPGGSSGILLYHTGGTPTNVPIPGTLALVSLALLGIGATARARKA